MEPGSCPEGVYDVEDPSCNIGGLKPYELSLTKTGDSLIVSGSDTGRLNIIRKPLEDLAEYYGTNDESPRYEYTKVETDGMLSSETSLDITEPINVYRTPWQPIFNDLRGIGFLMTQNIDGGVRTRNFYETPRHNKTTAWGDFNHSYDECFALTEFKYDFCIKKDGGNFVMGSKKNLGSQLTLWLDEQFKR